MLRHWSESQCKRTRADYSELHSDLVDEEWSLLAGQGQSDFTREAFPACLGHMTHIICILRFSCFTETGFMRL